MFYAADAWRALGLRDAAGKPAVALGGLAVGYYAVGGAAFGAHAFGPLANTEAMPEWLARLVAP